MATLSSPTPLPNKAPIASSRHREHWLWLDAALLALILVAFARVAWRLDYEDLWWDESLTLQRAESSLPAILLNEIVLYDGLTHITTTDQHPFFYFLLEAVVLRLAGKSEYALRFVSSAAATLILPLTWVFAGFYVRRGVFPRTAPAWAVLLAAVSPFLLWFGQEARPYALWALLAMVSTYALLRATELPAPGKSRRLWVAAYVIAVAMLLTTHYYAVFLLPVHAILIFLALRRRGPVIGALVGLAVVLAGVAIIAGAYWYIVLRQNAGANFRHISWKLLLPDLLNAFSLGLSVDIRQVFAVDLLFGLLAVAGSGWALRSSTAWRANGWVPVAMVAIPVSAVLIGDKFHPIYMTARHLSLIAGPFIILVGVGLATAWMLRPSLAVATAAILVAVSIFSSYSYFTEETYAQADLSRLASDLDDRLAPGDLVLIKSPFAWRMFSYYQPKIAIHGTPGSARYESEIDVYGAPLLQSSWQESYDFFERMTEDRRRIWLLVSGTQAHMDLEGRVEQWLDEHLFKLQETTYFSQSSLKSNLYLPQIPVFDSVPESIENKLDVEFGDLIHLHGYDVAFPPTTDLALPITLYWEAVQPMDRRYKYRIELIEVMEDGSWKTVTHVEQEPYMGAIPTIYWDPGKIIVEYTDLLPADWARIEDDAARYRLTVELYDAETLEKLPVTKSDGLEVTEDGASVVLPYRPL